MTIQLRQYQLDALDAEARHRAEHPEETRLAIVLPTGAGKTITFAERARRFLAEAFNDITVFPHQRVLILVHTDELTQQAYAKVKLVVGDAWTVGIVKAERDEMDADIVIGSVATLANPERRARITDVGLVIVDECHHATAASYQAIMRHFGCMIAGPETGKRAGNTCICPILPRHHEGACPQGTLTPALGFTATLERGDGQGLGEIWQDVAYSRDVSWGVRKGFLVNPVGYRLEIEPGVFRARHSGDVHEIADRIFSTNPADQDAQLVEGLAPERIVEKWLQLAAGLCDECLEAVDALNAPAMPSYCPNGCLGKARPTVAFMPLVRSARMLALCFNDAGIRADVIHGDMPSWQRREALAAYEAGEIQVLVNAMVLTEGWDSPRTKCVIVGRPTKSRSLFVQMAGRGLRPVPGVPVEEQDCILITVADATTDLCSVADLSDRPLDRKAEGSLVAMEDQWNIGKELDEANRQKLWTGHVDPVEFDPLVKRSSKVWRATEHGTPFLPISIDREYVFIVGTSVFVYEEHSVPMKTHRHRRVRRLHNDLPDLELALTVAEQEAEERGGDIGRLIADRNRPWRKQVPSQELQEYAERLGLGPQVAAILASKAGGKAGKVSDLIAKTVATRALEPMVQKIKEATK